MSVTKLVAQMQAVPEVKALLKAFKKDKQYVIDTDQMKISVTNLHTTRPVRRLIVRSIMKGAEPILEANLVEVQTRATLTGYLMDISRVEGALQTYINRVRDLLLLQFAAKLAVFRSKDDKNRVIEQGVFSDLSHYLAELDQLRQYVGYVVDDIDQASYGLQRLTTIMQSTSPAASKERNLR